MQLSKRLVDKDSNVFGTPYENTLNMYITFRQGFRKKKINHERKILEQQIKSRHTFKETDSNIWYEKYLYYIPLNIKYATCPK